MCVIAHKGRILTSIGHDNVRNEDFYRLLGGSLHFGETAEQGVRREMREELHSEIEDLKLLTVIENIFIYNGEPGHEIVFLFWGELANKGIYEQEKIHIVEDNYEFDAVWISTADISEQKIRLYPEFNYLKIL